MVNIEGIAVIILAAGGSTRMGEPKQLIQLHGKSLIRKITETVLATKCQHVYVVVGSDVCQITDELNQYDIELVTNDIWKEGIASSIRAGVNAVLTSNQNFSAILIVLVDQFYVNTALLNKLIEEYRNGAKIVSCFYDNAPGVPALFDCEYFNDLLSLRGDRGAKDILKKNQNKIAYIDFQEGIYDMDSKTDLVNI